MSSDNTKLTAFLDEVCGYVRCKAAHKDIRDELTYHIQDLKSEYTEQGKDEESALDMAITSMGGCEEIGARLNKQHKPQTEWSLILLTFIIAAFGAAVVVLSINEGTAWVSFPNYVFNTTVGVITLLIIIFFDYTKLYKINTYIYWLFVALFNIALLLFGNSYINGAVWIRIGSFSISLRTAIQLCIIPLSGFICKYRNGSWAEIIKLTILMLPLVATGLSSSSLSSLILVTICFAIVLTTAIVKRHFSGSPKKYLIVLCGAGVLCISNILIWLSLREFPLQRYFSFISRGKSDPYGYGWQRMQADYWLSVSKWIGKTQEINNEYGIYTLPSRESDYVLVNIIANFGWLAGIILIASVTFFILRLFMTARKTKNIYGYYLSMSCCTMLALKFILSISLNFGFVPSVSISMPLVSYGGSDYFISMILIGIVLSVWRRNNLVSAQPYKNYVPFKDKKHKDVKILIDGIRSFINSIT